MLRLSFRNEARAEEPRERDSDAASAWDPGTIGKWLPTGGIRVGWRCPIRTRPADLRSGEADQPLT